MVSNSCSSSSPSASRSISSYNSSFSSKDLRLNFSAISAQLWSWKLKSETSDTFSNGEVKSSVSPSSSASDLRPSTSTISAKDSASPLEIFGSRVLVSPWCPVSELVATVEGMNEDGMRLVVVWASGMIFHLHLNLSAVFPDWEYSSQRWRANSVVFRRFLSCMQEQSWVKIRPNLLKRCSQEAEFAQIANMCHASFFSGVSSWSGNEILSYIGMGSSRWCCVHVLLHCQSNNSLGCQTHIHCRILNCCLNPSIHTFIITYSLQVVHHLPLKLHRRVHTTVKMLPELDQK